MIQSIQNNDFSIVQKNKFSGKQPLYIALLLVMKQMVQACQTHANSDLVTVHLDIAMLRTLALIETEL